MQPLFISPLLFTLALSMPIQAFANASEASANASATLSMGEASIVVGSIALLSVGGQFVVESVEKTADGFVYVLSNISQDLSKVGNISVRVGGNALMVAGQSVQVVTESVGAVIMASGEIVAFIPNQIGQSLMYHSNVN